MKSYILTFLFILLCIKVNAQQVFIPNGKITFEKKINMKRQMGSHIEFPDEIMDRMQKYSSSEWELYFNQNTSLFKGKKKEGDANDSFFNFQSTNELYADYSGQKRILKKNIINDDYLLNDTIPTVRWKIMHDTRSIAGYECRKAIGRINDTIYVVAFYTDEILLKGGPEGFSGLPGMILGIAIPRLNTTWFATKVEAFTKDTNQILPPDKGKRVETEKDLAKVIELFSRYSYGKRKPEDVKKDLFGYLL